MPPQQQIGFLRRWRLKFLDFADLANRTIPLFNLHWYSQSDYPAVLTHQITSNKGGAFLHGLILCYLHAVALAAAVSTSCALLGLHLVSFTLICTHLPWLEESRQKLAVPIDELEESFGHLVGVNSAFDMRIKALYRVLLQVFVGYAVMRFPKFSLIYSSTRFSPLRVLTLGPVLSTIVLAFFSRDNLVSCLSVALTALAGILLCDTDLVALEDLFFAFEQETRTYYAHLRRSCARLEVLKVSRIFSLFFIIRLIEIVLRISAEAPSISMPLTCFSLGEELLRRSCDTTVSLIGFASFSITGIRYVMRGVRYVLRLQGAGEDLKDEFFLLCFSLAVFAEVPLSNDRDGTDCLIRFLSLYVLSWMVCILQTIDWQVRSLEEFPNIPQEHVLRIILAGCFVVASTVGSAILHLDASTESFMSLMSVIALVCEVSIKLGAYFTMLIDISMDDGRDRFWQNDDRLQFFLSTMLHAVFTMHYLIATCLLDTEAFFGLDVRVFTNGNVELQIEMCQTLEMRRMKAAALAIEFREATPEELAREDHTCPICYEEMESAAATVCSHIFHLDCLRSWIQLQIVCPMCRSPLNKERQLE